MLRSRTPHWEKTPFLSTLLPWKRCPFLLLSEVLTTNPYTLNPYDTSCAKWGPGRECIGGRILFYWLNPCQIDADGATNPLWLTPKSDY